MIANVLSIAGSDPSGGAGIQADLKAFSARGVFGMAALTALTAQNTQGVSTVHALPADFVGEQIRMVFSDVRVDAVKIGMIANAEIAAAVAEALRLYCRAPVALDPVMIAKGGAPLLDPEAMETVRRALLPLATVVTPNLPEAAALLGRPEARSREEMAAQARALLALGPQAALVKGGHLDDDESPDVLATYGGLQWFESRRAPTKNTHGTGCSLSSAIAAELAKGQAISEAICAAKDWLRGAIEASGQLSVGAGHGPIHHFHHLWTEQDIPR
ncbi:bifunctional hydroxymethylpyrimidine kinase/phosphomethylpyrimidine kinase [Rhizobium sp. TRM95796]|uniref:bifunctional hydroxymethylpyrimidine kinase/phosphomethylpyrimidine kinase n=1 Tax=Rhizobium sp. TRM95796 TaxID=2979862 RepID=UPI0021E74BF9|nr:bifunctional hydroxymethylpyrimidine kinase/phosphomethylpyrimidine kinase [Rhizobium sp. TRM95796]MCV3768430.1 bifunctional hydroxymethylpyrimidine kinase/phosphomethylpyrimidine kinase [Rhizobium sp. TRM95796]